MIGRDYNPGEPCWVPRAVKCLINAVTGQVPPCVETMWFIQG